MPVVVPGGQSSTSAKQTVTTVQLFDYLYKADGTAVANAQVAITPNSSSATISNPVLYIEPAQLTTTTDSNGYWQFKVPNSTLYGTSVNYLVEVEGLASFQVTIPAGAGPFQASANLATPGT